MINKNNTKHDLTKVGCELLKEQKTDRDMLLETWFQIEPGLSRIIDVSV